jgi:serine/threonine protein kinase
VAGHPLLDVGSLDTDDVESYLAGIGEVFVVHRGHDSNNISAGVRVGGQPWFVKWATDQVAVGHLESAVRFHRAVTHPTIIGLRAWFRTRSGMVVVHDWADGEVINDPLVPGGKGRDHPASALSRIRCLPAAELVAAVDTILDAHMGVAEAGFVAVDFYDGCLIYDFEHHVLRLCDLDMYRPGPYVLAADRQYGSTRFMAPEEFVRGATIDERTTVFNLGRAAFVLMGRGDNAGEPLFDVAHRATRPAPADRYQSVGELTHAWRLASAVGGATGTPPSNTVPPPR